MKAIGGFFELEMAEGSYEFHKNTLCLSTGRACLNFIIQHLKPRCIYVPFYSCNSLLEPIRLNRIEFRFYGINQHLELDKSLNLRPDDYLLYINYFGLKKTYILKLYKKYKDNLIIDNTQAFFEKSYKSAFSFNSARKFFGVPDGGYLYGINKQTKFLKKNNEIKYNYLINRLIGNQTKAYQEFKEYEKNLDSTVKSVSILSEKILSYIDYNRILQIRRRNFSIYSKAFEKLNFLRLDPDESFVPFAYPLLLNKITQRDKLIKKNIFIPTLWPDVNMRKMDGYLFEKNLSKRMLPLPVDHRYGSSDIRKVIKAVKSLI